MKKDSWSLFRALPFQKGQWGQSPPSGKSVPSSWGHPNTPGVITRGKRPPRSFHEVVSIARSPIAPSPCGVRGEAGLGKRPPRSFFTSEVVFHLAKAGAPGGLLVPVLCAGTPPLRRSASPATTWRLLPTEVPRAVARCCSVRRYELSRSEARWSPRKHGPSGPWKHKPRGRN